MPGIWNVNNAYTNNTKKISSKLTFEVGERFTGRVVSKGQGKDITIRLADGWQFIAELDENVNLDDLKLMKFEVDDFQNGKLKLKLVKGETNKSQTTDEVFQEIIDKEGLSSEDVKILEKMLKHNMPLTRENINKVKGLIEFNENIKLNPDEIDSFIQNYLESKGIDVSTSKGLLIKQNLTEFFKAFKNMSSEEIILFLENNIDFSGENIESFNKLFKSDISMEKSLTELLSKLEIQDNKLDEIQSKEVIVNKTNIENKELNNKAEKNNNINSLISKLYDSNDNSKNKVSMLSLLKSISGENKEIFNYSLRDVVDSRAESLSTKDFNELSALVSKLDDDDVMNLLKISLEENGLSLEDLKKDGLKSLDKNGKEILEQALSKGLEKDIKLTDKEFERFNNLIKYKIQLDNNEKVQTSNLEINKLETSQINKETQLPLVKTEIKNDLNLKDTMILSNKDLIKEDMINKINEIKDVVKDIIRNIENKNIGYEKAMEFIKNNISDFKVFNSISNEYYYLNFPVSVNAQEYPCKLVIKDNRKDGKKLDKTNAKMIVTVKTINLGEIDGYLTLRDNNIDVVLKCYNEHVLTLNNNKNKLIDGLRTLGLNSTVKVSLKEENMNLVNCGEFFNDLSISNIDIKV
ncbi:flagellar hook-length control protein FliK [Clostridium weizhouense]|uniref:Flagellar hook-length control protein FliK n=1 Tax=Clostridium weizhouense TaxID=2859781 RepID=A0ABS7AQB0_9CLOT|nr:flagellar hook-length control protein FliK [Clostridium weizhouense]MBW6410819.1 flagellar hook-length control protein FliK [Clostridium weizhouense]